MCIVKVKSEHEMVTVLLVVMLILLMFNESLAVATSRFQSINEKERKQQ